MKFIMPVLLIAFSAPLLGEKVSKDKLLEMYKGGLDTSVILKKIQADGIDFEPTTDTLIELGKAGLPKEILSALLSKDGASNGADSATDLVKAGQIDAAANVFAAALKANPADLKTRSLYAYVLLRQNKFDEAEKELHTIETAPDGLAYRDVLAKLHAFEAARRNLTQMRAAVHAKLRVYDGNGAADIVKQSAIAPDAKAVLLFQIALLQGRFEDCRNMLQQKELQGDTETVAKLKKGLRDTEEQVQTARRQMAHVRRTNFWGVGERTSRINANFLLSTKKLAEVFPDEKFPELTTCIEAAPPGRGRFERRTQDYQSRCVLETQLRMYISGIETHAGLSPLNAEAQNGLFFYSLLTRSYEETAAIGKQILSANGSLRVPIDYRTGNGTLIVDQKARLFSAEQGEFIPKYNDRLTGEFESFSIPFDGIAQIGQDGTWYVGNSGMEYVDKPATLTFSDSAKVPRMSMVEHVTNLYGQTAARQIIRNLGEFVKDVVNRPDLKATLLNTQAKEGSGVLSAVMFGTAGAMNPNLRPMTTQLIQNQAAAKQAARERDPLGSAAWQQMAIEQPFQQFWNGIEEKLDSVGQTILK